MRLPWGAGGGAPASCPPASGSAARVITGGSRRHTRGMTLAASVQPPAGFGETVTNVPFNLRQQTFEALRRFSACLACPSRDPICCRYHKRGPRVRQGSCNTHLAVKRNIGIEAETTTHFGKLDGSQTIAHCFSFPVFLTFAFTHTGGIKIASGRRPDGA